MDEFMRREHDLAEYLEETNMSKFGNCEDVCANCGRYYGQHLLYDGNKCVMGSINGWFPKRLADSLGTMKPNDFPEKPVCERIIPGSYKFSKGMAKCDLPFDHDGPCNPRWKD